MRRSLLKEADIAGNSYREMSGGSKGLPPAPTKMVRGNRWAGLRLEQRKLAVGEAVDAPDDDEGRGDVNEGF